MFAKYIFCCNSTLFDPMLQCYILLVCDMQYLKDHLTKEWRDVARLLGLTDSEIHITNYEYHGNTKEKTYQMFVKWIQRKGTRATLSNLTHALRGVDRPDLVCALKKGKCRICMNDWLQTYEESPTQENFQSCLVSVVELKLQCPCVMISFLHHYLLKWQLIFFRRAIRDKRN